MSRLLLFGALFAFACSLVIEPSEERCSADEGCPTDMVCVEGFCRAGTCVEGTAESCNGADDDCDGLIDEEQGIEVCNGADDDCDGMTDEGLNTIPEVCNNLDDDCDQVVDEDVPSMTDVCNDADDDCDGIIDEGRMEECNNQDDDCDGTADEETDGPLCMDTGMGERICRGQCVMPTCANDDSLACGGEEYCNTSVEPARCDMIPPRSCENDTQCDAGQVCFTEAGVCFDATPFGAPCTTDATCVAGKFCADLTAVGMAGTKTCTNTCCDDDDCENGALCASTHLGARICVPSGGANGIGGTCDTHEECASGYCRIFRRQCEAMCAVDGDCETDDACAFLTLSDDVTLTTGCFSAAGRRPAGAFCDGHLDCQSLFCNDRRCLAPCGTNGECTSGVCTSAFTGAGQAMSVCLADAPSGAAGSSCMSNDQCESARCNEGTCVAPCCSNAQCQQGRECQPIRTGDQWPTYCVVAN